MGGEGAPAGRRGQGRSGAEGAPVGGRREGALGCGARFGEVREVISISE
jgi:hypothetical protein